MYKLSIYKVKNQEKKIRKRKSGKENQEKKIRKTGKAKQDNHG